MIRYSYMIIDQLSSFGDDDDIRRMLEFIEDCFLVIDSIHFCIVESALGQFCPL